MFIFLVSSPGVAKGKAMGTNQLRCRLCIVLVFLDEIATEENLSDERTVPHILIMPAWTQGMVHTGASLAALEANGRCRSSGQQLWGQFLTYMWLPRRNELTCYLCHPAAHPPRIFHSDGELEAGQGLSVLPETWCQVWA